MRVIPFILLLGLVACNASSKSLELNPDDRFDLIALNMEPILVSDAKNCVEIAEFSQGYKADGAELEQKIFDNSIDIWAHVDTKFLKGLEATDGYIKSGQVYHSNNADTKSLFETSFSRTEKAHVCGEYAGKLSVKIGVMSLRESFEAAQVSNSKIFEEMGLDIDTLLTGLRVMELRAGNLSSRSSSEKISCVALYQGNKSLNPQFEPYSNIWMTALVRSIDAGEIAPEKMGDDNEYWRVLVDEGVSKLSEVSGVGDFNTQCEGWLNEAILKQQAVN